MAKKIVLAGGTGFIGNYFRDKFVQLGYQVIMIARKAPAIPWNKHQAIVDAVEGSEMVINLAGKSVNCRYHEQNKQEILHSRTGTTKLLGDAVKACEKPPALWINASTATIYRHAEDRPMTEADGEIGKGFSVDVATKWEKSFFQYKLTNTRQVALRIAIVLGANGGVMTPYKNLVKFGLGGVQGNGKQMFSFIHVEDLFQIVLFMRDHPELEGIFNCSAPHPVKNEHLMRVLRHRLNRSFGLPAPAPLLELGALFLRTETELILKSRWVLPERLLQAGYAFRYPTIEATIQDVV
ncbi:TIGR01777 family oxidoreductase [Gracilibacillus caseinilyticus]|uniref:TIGR01777 family oxidoreductase n=1 Tax=Gracilibacillus caseinilyticus TaxID=2932256 RepID=A0ABY4F489_9BACI|nr:TIGR01777 family oxidoreductase [Gracilibacillus caseinilyticus]UOQ49286.1 TIGR01777 family oxidoreductase [Gracilibacillus caseinilyticus]